MRNLPRFSSLLLVTILLCFAAPVFSQDLDNVTIAGRVMDQNGAVIPGASVTTTLLKTKADANRNRGCGRTLQNHSA
jgi:hypothetical protein